MTTAFLLLVAGAAAQQPDSARVAQFKTMPAAALGRAYLLNENTLRLIAMARQGANVMLSAEDSTIQVTAANVDTVAAEYERRRATYVAAIRVRGFTPMAGEYELSFTRCPEASEPAIVAVTHDDFVVRFDGLDAGIMVERTLVVGQGGGDDGTYWSGAVGASESELRPMDRTGCALVLAPYRRPRVVLERAERLIGAWEGRWDEEFDVRFTVTATDSGYAVRYEWQEYAGGSFDTLDIHFHPSSRDAIRGGPIELIVERDGVRAVGHFRRTRTARLRRVPGD